METTLATPFSYNEGKKSYLVDAYPLNHHLGARTGIVLVKKIEKEDPTIFSPMSPSSLLPQALLFPARGGFWLNFAIGLRTPFPSTVEQATSSILGPLLDELARHYTEVPASFKGDADAERFSKDWTRRCSELELAGESNSPIYQTLLRLIHGNAHLADVRGIQARWVAKPLVLPESQLPIDAYSHWRVATVCFPTWDVAYATARRLAAGFPRCTMKNPNPDETTRLLWPVPEAGRYLTFGGPGEWLEREGEYGMYRFRLHHDAKEQIETLLVSQIPTWAPQYQLSLHSCISAERDSLFDLATADDRDDSIFRSDQIEWLLVRSREDGRFMDSKSGWACVAPATRLISYAVSDWRDRYRVTSELLQMARLPYSLLAVTLQHTLSDGWTVGEATGVEKTTKRPPTRVHAHDEVKEELRGAKKHLYFPSNVAKPHRQTGLGVYFGKRKQAPDEEEESEQPQQKKIKVD
jgi:hypothetical protein